MDHQNRCPVGESIFTVLGDDSLQSKSKSQFLTAGPPAEVHLVRTIIYYVPYIAADTKVKSLNLSLRLYLLFLLSCHTIAETP